VISALIAGRLYGTPQARTGRTGKAFATAKLRVAVGDESVFVSVITFRASAIATLTALSDGDSVAMTGELTAKVWTDRNGEAKPALDMVAHAVLTLYALGKKRKAVAQREDSQRTDEEPQLELPSAASADVAESSAAKELEFDDDIPF
jgi:single-stranded DNA-binding protein